MLTIDNRKPQWFFYPAWVVLSVISIPISWWIGWVIISQIVNVVGGRIEVGGQSHITEDFLFGYVFIPLLGLITGLLQYLLLHYYLPRMGWWIVTTIFGWLLFAIVPLLLSVFAFFPTSLSPALAGVFLGGSIGLFQWLVLRQQARHAALWIVTSALGWAVAFLLTDGAISSQQEVLIVVLLPPIVASLAWWLLLDKLPYHDSNGGNTPRDTL